MERDQEKRRTRVLRLTLTLLLLYLLLGIVSGLMIIVWTVRHSDAQPPEETAENGYGVGWALDAEDPAALPGAESPEQNVTIAGLGAVIVPAGATAAAVDFYNPEENKGLYDLAFELRLCDDSPQGYEVLYTSALVQPGKHIYEIQISRPLDRGVYEAVVHIQPYRTDAEHTRTNNADIVTALVVR